MGSEPLALVSANDPSRLRCRGAGLALFDADGVIQASRQGWMEELTAWGGSRAGEFLLAIAAADAACLTGDD